MEPKNNFPLKLAGFEVQVLGWKCQMQKENSFVR